MRFCALTSLSISAAAVVALAACESSDPPTPVSKFRQEDTITRNIHGQVFLGTEPVEGAIVLVSASRNLASDVSLEATADPSLFPRTVPTDANGLYQLRFTPIEYDISVHYNRDVFTFRDLTERGFLPSLGAEGPVRGFQTRIVPTTNPPPAPGHALAFFVSGDDARTIEPSDAGALVATSRRFDSLLTVHAVEYVANLGLASAVAEGQTDIRAVSETIVSPLIAMRPITKTKTITFEIKAPPGYTVAPLDIEMDFTPRTSNHKVARVSPGAALELEVATGARYATRATATRDGAVSTTARFVFDTEQEKVTVELPQPVSSESPFDDTAPPGTAPSGLDAPILEPGGVLSARITDGVIEHTLVPAGGDNKIAIHVATTSGATTLPDLSRLGVPRPSGRYTWTMEHFPGLARVENFAGEDARVGIHSWKSAPRVILVR